MVSALDRIWEAIQECVQAGISTEGVMPSGLKVKCRAKACRINTKKPHVEGLR